MSNPLRDASARRVAGVVLVGLGVMLLLEGRVRAMPAVPPHFVSADEQHFAAAARDEATIFQNAAERKFVRNVRVISVAPVAGGGACGVCAKAPPYAPCGRRYMARVRYYTWLGLPYSTLRVECESVEREW